MYCEASTVTGIAFGGLIGAIMSVATTLLVYKFRTDRENRANAAFLFPLRITLLDEIKRAKASLPALTHVKLENPGDRDYVASMRERNEEARHQLYTDANVRLPQEIMVNLRQIGIISKAASMYAFKTIKYIDAYNVFINGHYTPFGTNDVLHGDTREPLEHLTEIEQLANKLFDIIDARAKAYRREHIPQIPRPQ